MRIAVVTLAVVVTIGVTRSLASAQLSAEELYEQGQAAFDDHDFQTAIALWTRSYELSHQPLLLFNLGQARRLAGDCALALAAYRRFVAVDPTSAQRPLADDFVRELAPRCGATALTPPSPTPPPPIVGAVPARPGRTLRIAGLTTASAGALSITIGLVLGHRASTLGDEITRSCAISCDWAEQRSKDVAGRRYAVLGYSLDALGAAAIVGGAALFYLGDRRSAISVSPRSSDGGATVTWSASW